jgi:IclR family mhp operon transcriptional activator
VRDVIAMTRKKGYGERYRQIFDKTGAIAVPIRRGEQVLACLNISFIASALSPREAASRYLKQFRDAARLIEGTLAAQE